MAPVPGESNRFVFALPQPDGLVYVGLTDEPVDGAVPDVPVPTEAEIGFLLDVIGAGARRGRCAATTWSARTPGCGRCSTRRRRAPPTCPAGTRCSRRPTGVVTVVGGKLTTYRRMAEDAVDAVLARTPLRRRSVPHDGRCRWSAPHPATRWPGSSAPRAAGPEVRRRGARPARARPRRSGLDDADAARPGRRRAARRPRAELLWGVTHEGALDVDDLLDRRTRIGLVPADRARAEAAAAAAFATAAHAG